MHTKLFTMALCAAVIAAPAGCAAQKKHLVGGTRISPATHVASGKMLEAQNNFAGAAEQYQHAITSQPDLTIAYHRLAELYIKLGRFDQARDVLRAAIESGADEASLRNNLGFALMKIGRFDEAEQMLAAALAISPTFHRARMNLGLVHARAGRIDESIATFEKIVPREDALYNVAVIRMQERDFVTAAWAFSEAVAIAPNFADARAQLEKALFLAQHTPHAAPERAVLNAIAQSPPIMAPPVTAPPVVAVAAAVEPLPPQPVAAVEPVIAPPAPAVMRDITPRATAARGNAVRVTDASEPATSSSPESPATPPQTIPDAAVMLSVPKQLESAHATPAQQARATPHAPMHPHSPILTAGVTEMAPVPTH